MSKNTGSEKEKPNSQRQGEHPSNDGQRNNKSARNVVIQNQTQCNHYECNSKININIGILTDNSSQPAKHWGQQYHDEHGNAEVNLQSSPGAYISLFDLCLSLRVHCEHDEGSNKANDDTNHATGDEYRHALS